MRNTVAHVKLVNIFEGNYSPCIRVGGDDFGIISPLFKKKSDEFFDEENMFLTSAMARGRDFLYVSDFIKNNKFF